ncbi:hypothetical protein LR48_Vigan07g097300 [Vigna angularis]|uniref:Uncharacterized protein n=1 Tax=Phaseolus angularis TaxID=3914 RepID=A0A0L9UXI8_PHAAN|nr:hypothetical protein LR48_Vigan07g097200 [Vigna angularis]KOM47269.1 hypothetical protein LR48_Vigan07g097300 [Vigna angularis]
MPRRHDSTASNPYLYKTQAATTASSHAANSETTLSSPIRAATPPSKSRPSPPNIIFSTTFKANTDPEIEIKIVATTVEHHGNCGSSSSSSMAATIHHLRHNTTTNSIRVTFVVLHRQRRRCQHHQQPAEKSQAKQLPQDQRGKPFPNLKP